MEEECTPSVLAAIMDHMKIGESSKHILETVPSHHRKQKNAHTVRAPENRTFMNGSETQTSKRRWGKLSDSVIREAKLELTYLLFRSCIGKFAKREITSSILHGAPNVPRNKSQILSTPRAQRDQIFAFLYTRL